MFLTSPKNSYERWILSFWLMKINATVAGITKIAAPQAKLQRKFAKEGVIITTFYLHSSLILIPRIELQ